MESFPSGGVGGSAEDVPRLVKKNVKFRLGSYAAAVKFYYLKGWININALANDFFTVNRHATFFNQPLAGAARAGATKG